MSTVTSADVRSLNTTAMVTGLPSSLVAEPLSTARSTKAPPGPRKCSRPRGSPRWTMTGAGKVDPVTPRRGRSIARLRSLPR